LSTRIIHFSKSRLIWECRGCVALEEFPIQTYRRLLRTGTGRNRIEDWVDTCRLFDNRIDESRHIFGSNAEGALQNVSENSIVRSPRDNRLICQDDDLGRRGNSKFHAYLNWLRAVEQYSGRHLTYETDKLPAVSGLAAAVALTIKDDYLAGIWKGDMYEDCYGCLCPLLLQTLRIGSLPFHPGLGPHIVAVSNSFRLRLNTVVLLMLDMNFPKTFTTQERG
jgi:hypothetical protein